MRTISFVLKNDWLKRNKFKLVVHLSRASLYTYSLSREREKKR